VGGIGTELGFNVQPQLIKPLGNIPKLPDADPHDGVIRIAAQDCSLAAIAWACLNFAETVRQQMPNGGGVLILWPQHAEGSPIRH
jgi:hypothetical protein